MTHFPEVSDSDQRGWYMPALLFLGRSEGMLVGSHSLTSNYLILSVSRCLRWMMSYTYKNNLLWITTIMVSTLFYNFSKETKLLSRDSRTEFYDKKLAWIDGMNISVTIYVRHTSKCAHYIIKIITYSTRTHTDAHTAISKHVWTWSMGESSWKVYNSCVQQIFWDTDNWHYPSNKDTGTLSATNTCDSPPRYARSWNCFRYHCFPDCERFCQIVLMRT